jgi:hypothetical protein
LKFTIRPTRRFVRRKYVTTWAVKTGSRRETLLISTTTVFSTIKIRDVFADQLAAVLHREVPVRLNLHPLISEFDSQGPPVRRLQKSGAELPMHFNGGTNYPVGDQVAMFHARG